MCLHVRDQEMREKYDLVLGFKKQNLSWMHLSYFRGTTTILPHLNTLEKGKVKVLLRKTEFFLCVFSWMRSVHRMNVSIIATIVETHITDFQSSLSKSESKAISHNPRRQRNRQNDFSSLFIFHSVDLCFWVRASERQSATQYSIYVNTMFVC